MTEADLGKLFDLEMKVRDDIEALHTAVNQIRGVQSQLEIVKAHTGDKGDQGKPILSSTEDLDRKMAPIEQELIQVKMKSSEGNLGFPNMLNEQYETFRSTLELADNAPTQPECAIFDYLHGRLQTELAAWKQVASRDVPALNELLREQNVALVEVSSSGK